MRLVEQPSSLCVANDASVPKVQPITGLLALIGLAAVPTKLVLIANAMLSVLDAPFALFCTWHEYSTYWYV